MTTYKKGKGIYILDLNHSFGKKLLVIIVTMIIVLILSLSFFTIGTKAKEASTQERHKYFTQIEVKYGEDLYEIADRYYSHDFKSPKAYVQEIRNLNSLYSEVISPGTFLIIPYYDNIIK